MIISLGLVNIRRKPNHAAQENSNTHPLGDNIKKVVVLGGSHPKFEEPLPNPPGGCGQTIILVRQKKILRRIPWYDLSKIIECLYRKSSLQPILDNS